MLESTIELDAPVETKKMRSKVGRQKGMIEPNPPVATNKTKGKAGGEKRKRETYE